MDALLDQREKWKETCKRRQQDIYRLERQVEKLELATVNAARDFEERLLQKDKLLVKIDVENQRLQDDIKVLELEINVLRSNQT